MIGTTCRWQSFRRPSPRVFVARAGRRGARPGALAELALRYEDVLDRLTRLERKHALVPLAAVSGSPPADGLSRREREVLRSSRRG